MRQQFRVQAPELPGPEQLRPAPIPNDTYSAPVQPPVDNRLSSIADALGHFNQNLKQFGSVHARFAKQQQDQEESDAARGVIAGHTHEQYMEKWRGGQMPNYATPNANLMIGKVAGRYDTDEIINGVQARVNSGEIDITEKNPDGSWKHDLPGLVTQAALDRLGKIEGINDAQRRAYRAGMEEKLLGYREDLIKKQDTIRQNAFENQLAGTAATAFTSAIENAPKLPDGRTVDPAAAKDLVRSTLLEMAPNLPVRQRGPMLTNQLLNVVSKLASDPRYVLAADAIRNAEWEDPKTGQKIPSLASTGVSNPERAAKLRDLDATITTTKDTAALQWRNRELEDHAFNAMRAQNGSIAVVQPQRFKLPSGNYADAGKEAQTNAARRYFTWSQQDAAEFKRPPGIVLDREVRVAQASNIEVPHLKQALDDAVPAALNGDFVTNNAARAKVYAAYDTYARLAAENLPWMEGKMGLSENTKKFFRTMHILTTSGGQDTDTAMNMAAAVLRNPDKNNTEGLKQEAALRASSIARGSDTLSWGSYVPRNAQEYTNRVEEVAGVLMRHSGLKPNEALDKAADYVKKNSFQYNGTAISGISFMKPAEAHAMFDRKIDEALPLIKQVRPELGKGDLAFRNLGDGRFMVTEKMSGLPVSVAHVGEDGRLVGGPVVITKKELLDMRDRDVAQARAVNDKVTAETSAQTRENLIGSAAVHSTLEGHYKRRRPKSAR